MLERSPAVRPNCSARATSWQHVARERDEELSVPANQRRQASAVSRALERQRRRGAASYGGRA
eukprot:6775596-Prymnesium_polylepis.1